MIAEWLAWLSMTIEANLWLAPVLALLAGLVTSLTPCSLSSVSLVIAYVSGTAGDDTRKAFRYSIVFSLGTTITFTLLGVVASIAGQLIQGSGSWWYVVLGVVMTLMALQTWGVINVIPRNWGVSTNPRKGYLGALLAGILGGLFSSPCATPVLVVLLAIVAEQGSLLWGSLLLLLYSAGHSILILVAGTSMGFTQRISNSVEYKRYNKVITIVLGSAILLLAFYMFYLGF